MSGPGPDIVRIKRRHDELAPDALLVERPGKRQHTQDVHYVLKKDTTNAVQGGLFPGGNVASQPATSRPTSSHASGNGLETVASIIRERRVFHLKRPSNEEGGIKKRKVKDKGDGIATFIERRGKKNADDLLKMAEKGKNDGAGTSAVDDLKRPGKGSAVRAGGRPAPPIIGSSTTEPAMTAVADSLNQFAMEEAAKELLPPRPKVTAKPKLPPQRSRELHQQRIADKAALDLHKDFDTEMDDDADYVYDTYVLAPVPGAGTAQVDAQGSGGNVGYLVITEEDQAVWETYIEDEPSDKDWDSDEDDENAEDWYGADYPDDEVASDDEYNRNAYGYRAHGSDNEEWDADTGKFSDDEYERQMNPWRKKTPDKFSKYLSGAVEGVDEED